MEKAEFRERRSILRIRGCFCWIVLFMAALPAISWAQKSPSPHPVPEAAVPAVLAAFDKYEVVGMGVAHGLKDLDDFILSLVRNPAFAEKVNDIVVECGNSLYQPMLDRYIAGESVPFVEVRKVWRNTTQPMCDWSGFFEQFYPLVRAINQRLPPGKRLRVLTGDPPINWDMVKNYDDRWKFDRDSNIAFVMEKEVLSKHRKALMLFGEFHLMHGQEKSAVSIYEQSYPHLTFVISEIGFFGTDLPSQTSNPFAEWPIPSLARIKGTDLGALDLGHFLPKQVSIDDDCKIRVVEFPKSLQKPMEELVDSLIYVAPQDLRLREQVPADIALDTEYRTELRRREALPDVPDPGSEAIEHANQAIVKGAEDPVFVVPEADEMMKGVVQSCLDRKSHGNTPRQ